MDHAHAMPPTSRLTVYAGAVNLSPITATNTTTCYTLSGVTGSTNVFVLIRANNVTP